MTDDGWSRERGRRVEVDREREKEVEAEVWEADDWPCRQAEAWRPTAGSIFHPFP